MFIVCNKQAAQFYHAVPLTEVCRPPVLRISLNNLWQLPEATKKFHFFDYFNLPFIQFFWKLSATWFRRCSHILVRALRFQSWLHFSLDKQTPEKSDVPDMKRIYDPQATPVSNCNASLISFQRAFTLSFDGAFNSFQFSLVTETNKLRPHLCPKRICGTNTFTIGIVKSYSRRSFLVSWYNSKGFHILSHVRLTRGFFVAIKRLLSDIYIQTQLISYYTSYFDLFKVSKSQQSFCLSNCSPDVANYLAMCNSPPKSIGVIKTNRTKIGTKKKL